MRFLPKSLCISANSAMSHSQRFKSRGGPRNRGRRNHEGEGGGGSRERHPPHLKGKAIGMYYARMSKEKKENEQKKTKPLGEISLSREKREQIKHLLLHSKFLENFFIIDNGSYDHIGDSVFKRDFMRIIHGNIEDKLKAGSSIKTDEKLDTKLLQELQNKENSEAYKRMLSIRKKLPAYDKQHEILELLERSQVLVVSGETGCGKTTQVAQFILDDHIRKGKGSLCRIVCTQPRRISAVSVASRVADERAEPLGISVGYQIRLERKFPRDRGSMCFCTTGVLLKQMENDPCLTDYSHLILDEIHERDVMSDFLITIIKQIITHRKDLKVILMSATLNSEQFSKYFNGCPQINIPGFTYPVEEFYLEDVIERTGFVFDESNQQRRGGKFNRGMRRQSKEDREYSDFIEPYVRQLEHERKYSRNTCVQLRNPQSEQTNLDLIFELIRYICKKEKDTGAILVFLTGYMEISKLYTLLEESGKFPKRNYLIFPLHSQMPTVDQRQIFDRPPTGVRKIILSTNIAETSITIDDVVFVIDCGKIKISNFNVETNTQTLMPEWVSLANADQRKGRAGRVQAGVCFHLFTRARRMILDKYLKPEILRTRLEDVILMMKILQLGKAEPFFARLLDAPDPAAVALSLELLKRLNALDDNENLTPLGYHLGKLPMGPQMGKMLLMGAIFSCLDPVLSVAAFLDFKDAFQMPLGKEKLVSEKKLELSNGQQSDHLLFAAAMRRYENIDRFDQRRFCWDYFLSQNTMNLLSNMKKQFMEYLYELNFVPNTDPQCKECNVNSDNLSLIKAVICAGLYPNVLIGRQKKTRSIFYTPEGARVEIHPKSILNSCASFESPLLVYYLKIRSSSVFVHDATVVHPLPLVFFGDHCNYQEFDGGRKVICVSDRIRFKCSESTALTIKELRDRMNWFLEYKISHPGVVDWSADGEEVKVLRAIMELITSEDLRDMDLDYYDDCD